MITAYHIRQELNALGSKRKALFLSGYFKTEKGGYGAGDVFLGIAVPNQRKIAKKNFQLTLTEISKLLKSKTHEHRFTALEILVLKYEKANSEIERRQIFDFYLRHRKYINNWDLVDTSVEYIVGAYLKNKPKKLLYRLAESKNVWDRRLAIVATFHFIKQRSFEHTIKLSKILMKDRHHLIHKATGWMLREIGKRDLEVLLNFVDAYKDDMPRVMLRYATEKFPPEIRELYIVKPKTTTK